MASKKDIDRRIKSVKNTKKITYAMKLVSAAKLKKAQDSVVNARVYTDSLAELLTLLKATVSASTENSADKNNKELTNPLLATREVKNILLVIIGGSRGLAGGYNSNLNKKVDSHIASLKTNYPALNSVDSILIGKKPAEYYRRINRVYVESHEELPDEPLKWPIIDICNRIAESFTSGKYDEVQIIYTKFKSAISSVPVVEKLLPLSPPKSILAKASSKNANAKEAEGTSSQIIGGTKVLFEPTPQTVFARLVPQIFKALVQQACLDAKASEYASRMTAMDAATKNAGELITKLTLLSNKLRQQKITSELLDIIGGAEAVA